MGNATNDHNVFFLGQTLLYLILENWLSVILSVLSYDLPPLNGNKSEANKKHIAKW